jgi:integrase
MWYTYVVEANFPESLAMPSYLQKRRRRWYAILEIPLALRSHFGGKVRFVRSLETDSRTVAERRVMPVVVAWKGEIATARNEPVDDDVAYWRRALRNAKTEEQRQSIEDQIYMAAWDIGASNVDQIGQAPSSDPEARRFYASATGALVPFSEHLDEWLTTSRVTAKTLDMQRSAVKRFAAKFAMVQDVTKPEVRRWITGLMNDDGLRPNSVNRILSALRGYWRYLQSVEVAGEDHEPFSKLNVARHNKRTSPRFARQPFEPADVVKLLEAAINGGDDQLADLIKLGMWTGCRIEELCALKFEQVKGDNFSVGEAKTEAGWRDIPIHRELAQTMARLIEDSKDGYVLSGLTKNKYGDRSNAIGKRFGRLKMELGFGPQLVFHSIRKTVVTILENAGVAENVVADLVGHEKTTMTFGLYSGGLTLAVKQEALDKLAY